MSIPKPAYLRVLARVDTTTPGECWHFMGALHPKTGYGTATRGSSPAQGLGYVHRIVFEALVGPIPEGMQIDHVCHTLALAAGMCRPGRCHHRSCVNPSHLEVVTARENNRRGGRRGQTHCVRGHEFTPENAYFHRGVRQCQACRRIHREAWRARSKAGESVAVFGEPVRA